MTERFQYPPQSYIITALFLSYLAVISASPFISDSIFRDGSSSSGRNLLQALTSCPINFEIQNYTIISSECRGPQYLASACCPALKQFACPFSEELNDLTNNCASTMFSYITLSAKYPTGLFANECRDDNKEGLDCSGYLPGQYYNYNGSLRTCKPSALLILAGAFLGLLLKFL